MNILQRRELREGKIGRGFREIYYKLNLLLINEIIT